MFYFCLCFVLGLFQGEPHRLCCDCNPTHTITTPTPNIALIGSYKAVEEQIRNFGGFVPLNA